MTRIKLWMVQFGLWIAALGGFDRRLLGVTMPSPEVMKWIKTECEKFDCVVQSGDFKRGQVYSAAIKRFGEQDNHLYSLAIALVRARKHAS